MLGVTTNNSTRGMEMISFFFSNVSPYRNAISSRNGPTKTTIKK
jgi:hypothetical protein